MGGPVEITALVQVIRAARFMALRARGANPMHEVADFCGLGNHGRTVRTPKTVVRYLDVGRRRPHASAPRARVLSGYQDGTAYLAE